jgi:hypothetical protein
VLRNADDPKYKGLFVTTLHLISSGLIKLSQLQPVSSLFRGVGRGGKFQMPDRCVL